MDTAAAAACKGPVVRPVSSANRPSRLVLERFASLKDYVEASAIQETFVERNLVFKRQQGSDNALNQPVVLPPPPTLLSFEMHPTYTGGRRQAGQFSPEELALMRDSGASFVQTKRGGQTTFHGPGQIVMYPIIDLRQFGLQVRCYVRLLENSIIETLAQYDIPAFVTGDTGVWVSDTEKIAAIGIHVRRGITSHGLALNVSTDTQMWFDRIVACGLPDKKTVSMHQKGCSAPLSLVCETLSRTLAKNLGCELQIKDH